MAIGPVQLMVLEATDRPTGHLGFRRIPRP
jgi:hypothetical protein